MKWPNFENPLGSLSDTEMADMEEACLRGELSREDFETYVELNNNKNEKRKKFNDEARHRSTNR